MISILRYSAAPLRGSIQLSFTVTLPWTCDMLKKKYYSVTLWPHWMMPSNGSLPQKILQKWEQKFKCFHSSILRTTTISCFNTKKLSFIPAAPRACPSSGYLHVVCHWLTYKEDNESSVDPRMEDWPEDNILACCLPSIAEEEDSDTEEHFPTISLDDDFWMEEPVPERHLCIHENSHHDLCPDDLLCTVWSMPCL